MKWNSLGKDGSPTPIIIPAVHRRKWVGAVEMQMPLGLLLICSQKVAEI